MYLLACRVCEEAPYIRKAKTKFWYKFYKNNKNKKNYKDKFRVFRKRSQKLPQKPFHNRYCCDDHLGFYIWDFILSEQCETHKQLATFRGKPLATPT